MVAADTGAENGDQRIIVSASPIHMDYPKKCGTLFAMERLTLCHV